MDDNINFSVLYSYSPWVGDNAVNFQGDGFENSNDFVNFHWGGV